METTSTTNGVLSPPMSVNSHMTLSNAQGHFQPVLPTTRVHQLKPGSQKEISLINYLDDQILQINRRYAKKFSEAGSGSDAIAGYMNYDEVVYDVNPLFDVVWISGTPTLQIPYLLSLAGILCSYMPAFEFSASSLGLLKKFDLAFAQVLQPASHISSGTTSIVNMTEKVRIKSLVEETRIIAVQTASHSGIAATYEDLSTEDDSNLDEDSTLDDETLTESADEDADADAISLGLSRVYNHTLEILGDSLT